MATTTTEAKQTLDAHLASIDTMHRQIVQTPGVDREKLQHVVDTYKKAAQKFHDDALGCMN